MKTYHFRKIEGRIETLFSMEGKRARFLASQSLTGWELYPRSDYPFGLPDGELLEITKEEAALILFQAREPA